MACRKCGSDWTTPTGKDCNRCPHCDKLQLWVARNAGRWVEPVEVKQCVQCGRDFEAIGTKQIKQRRLCHEEQCDNAHKKAGRQRRAAGVFVMQQVHGAAKPVRQCKRCGKGPLNRNQKDYCSRECAGAEAREFKRGFMGLPADVRKAIAIADFFYDWDYQRPKPRKNPRKRRNSCQHCGDECNEGATRFCSLDCTKAWRGDRRCKCGAVVPNRSAYSRPACDACKRESRRQRRRMYGSYRRRCRTYGGYFNSAVKPRDVFVRDGWRCHICSKRTSKLFRLSDPRSATVDHHPIPLSKGGDHDWCNVKCACFECNTNKGNKWDGQRRMAFSML